MSWASVGDFLHMGGYGLYVWGSFGACALVFAAECAGIAARRRAVSALPPDDAHDLDERPIHEA